MGLWSALVESCPSKRKLWVIEQFQEGICGFHPTHPYLFPKMGQLAESFVLLHLFSYVIKGKVVIPSVGNMCSLYL